MESRNKIVRGIYLKEDNIVDIRIGVYVLLTFRYSAHIKRLPLYHI